MRSILSVGAVAITFLALLSIPVCAEMYKYVDKKGNEHYTDSLGSVPEEYRGNAVAIDKDLERNPGFVQETRPPQKGEPETPDISLRGRMSSSIKEGIGLIKVWTAKGWIQHVGILTIFVILFIVAGKVGKALGHRRVGTILRVIITAVIFLLFLYAYRQHITDSFVQIKEKVMGIKDQREKRDQVVSETAK
ncbi:MAG: DUF4124 domain-containing protein [bacterium]